MNSMIRAGGLQGYEAFIKKMGADPLPLLAKHRIDARALVDAESFIPLDAVLALMEESAEVTGCPDFGLQLSCSQDIRMLGILAIVIQNAPTVVSAITDASRYLFMHSPAFEIALDDPSPLYENSVSLRFGIQLSKYVQQRQSLDYSVAYMYQLSRSLGGKFFQLCGVSLPHTPIASEETYKRFFGSPVHFAQPHAALHVHRSALEANLAPANPILRQLALEHISRHFPLPRQPLSSLVRQTVTHTLGATRGTKGDISALLGMHPRTLQRQLAQEGVSFDDIREDVYRKAALQLLLETTVPLKQLALVLGFSEHSAFTRSCRRWFGSTPSTIRKVGSVKQ